MTKGLVTKKRIGVLMGGLSAERDISMRSGLAIYQNLQEMGYDAVLIDVGNAIANVIKKEKVRVIKSRCPHRSASFPAGMYSRIAVSICSPRMVPNRTMLAPRLVVA